MGKSDLIEDETSLAYRLSNLRKDHDLSQKQLAATDHRNSYLKMTNTALQKKTTWLNS